MGGIPTIRHSEIRDITATLLTELQLSHSSNPLLMSPSLIAQLTPNQLRALISVLMASGTQAKTHFLMLGFSTPMRQATVL